jgi:hypothetical protein
MYMDGISLRKVLTKTPQGQAAYAAKDNAHHAKKLRAAKTLSKAKKGDKKAKKDIVTVHKLAAKGHPGAKEAVRNLHEAAAAQRSPFARIHAAYRKGIT